MISRLNGLVACVGAHRASLPLLVAAWAFIAIFGIGCSSKRPGDANDAANRAAAAAVSGFVELFNIGALLAMSLAVLLTIWILFLMTKSYVVLGGAIGLVLSAFIVMKVPLNMQYAIVGAILGVGSNFMSSLSKEGAAATVVGRLAKFGASLVAASTNITGQLALETKQFQIARMIWSCIFVIAFTLLCGNIFEGLASTSLPWERTVPPK